jgi:hypothetical protein
MVTALVTSDPTKFMTVRVFLLTLWVRLCLILDMGLTAGSFHPVECLLYRFEVVSIYRLLG